MEGRYLFATSTGEGHSCFVQECYVPYHNSLSSVGYMLSCSIYVCDLQRDGQGELTSSLPRGKNPEIDNLSIFKILTSNLVSKVLW